MSLTTRTLANTGQPLCAPDGTLLSGVAVTFTLSSPRGLPIDAWDAVTHERVVGVKSATTDAAGEFSVALWPTDRSNVHALYLCRVAAPGVRAFSAPMPSGASPLPWAEFMAGGLPLSPVQLDILDTYLAGFDAALAAAEAAADRAEAAGGGGVDPSGALLVANRLSEFLPSPDAQVDARANLGLSVIDGGTFN